MVINMLESQRPTGMAIAGDAVRYLFRGLGARECPAWIPRTVRFTNDSMPAGILRTLCRTILAQLVPLFVPAPCHLVFTSHHAPLWRTGRHSMIVHDLISIEFPFQHRSQTLYFVLLLSRLIQAAARVIFISHSAAALARKHLGAIKTAWVIPSYNRRLAEYRPSDVSLLSRVAARRFFFVGARFLHKNLGLVLRATKELVMRGEANFKISVLGCTNSLWEQDGFKELEAKGFVEASDYAPQSEVERAYREATALIYVSFAEGQGLPPLEAMTHGCPVIAADVPVLRETCGDAALFVKPEDSGELADLMGRILRGDANEELAERQILGYGQAARYSGEEIKAMWSKFASSLAVSHS